LFVAAFVLGLGASNLWTIVLSFIATHTPSKQRSTVISAYFFQVTALTILGKCSYTPLNLLLQKSTHLAKLSRFRMVMGICTIFCVFGVFYLRRHRAVVRAAIKETDSDDAECSEDVAQSSYAAFATLSLIVIVQSMSKTAADVLWPIFVHDHYAWMDQEYGFALIVSSVLSTAAIATVPAMEGLCGRFFVNASCLGLAAVAGALAFSFQRPEALSILAHLLLVFVFFACFGFLDVSLKSLATVFMPKGFGGRAFGMLGTLTGIGSIAGNFLGSQTYQRYGPVLPFLADAVLLLASLGLLAAVKVCTRRSRGVLLTGANWDALQALQVDGAQGRHHCLALLPDRLEELSIRSRCVPRGFA
jgi:MFS family permease